MIFRSLLVALFSVGSLPAQSHSDLKPRPQRVSWQDLEIGVPRIREFQIYDSSGPAVAKIN